MSKTVETKVVEMKFDNSQFERSVKTTIGTLGKLKSALTFDSTAKKSFKDIETESEKIDFKALNKAIETVNKRFSLLGEIGTRVLHNITDRAYEAGSKVAKALTIEGASSGFKEYELKMGSIQTIMNATGEDVQTVNKYLDELNTYSDKTIYSFSDMTQNIGKFTNAGVDLKTAVKAIQGVSNAAALAGANSEEASRAMYNISQALSSGVMLNIDWKSIENANMATVEFREELIKTAVQCGTLKETSDGMYESLTTDNQGKFSQAFNAHSKFRDNLKAQWLTAEVLTKTLARYSDELDPLGQRAFQAATEVKTFTMMMDATKEAIGSGWAKTWELIFGDFEEAKVLWTSLSEVISGFVEKSADARNNILQIWHDDINGRATFILGIREAFEAVLHILKPIKQAFKEVFPPITAQHLLKFSVAFEEAMYKIRFSKTTLNNIHDAFKGFFSIIKFGIGIVKAFVKATFDSRSSFSKLGKIVLSLAGSFGKFISSIANIIEKNNVIYRIFSKMYKVIGLVLSPVEKLYKRISDSGKIKKASESFLDFFDAFTKPGANKMKIIQEYLKNLISKIPIAGGLVNKFAGFVKNLFETLVTKSGVLDKVKNAFKDCKNPLEILGTLFGTAKEKVENFFTIVDTKFNVVDKLKTAVSNCTDPFKTFAELVSGAAEKIKEFFTNFSEEKNKLIDNAKTSLENMPNPLKLIGEFASNAAEKVKGFFSQFSIESIKNTASSIDILGKIGRAFEKITSFAGNAFNITKDILGAIGRSIKEGFSSLTVEDVSEFIQAAAKAMALLFAAKMFKEMRKAFAKAGDAFEILGDSLKSLTGKTKSDKLYEIAKAIALLAISVYAIGTLPSDKIEQASTAIIALGAALIFVGKYINKAGIKDFKKPAASMAIFAVAIGILALAVSGLARIQDGLERGTVAAIVLGVALAAFAKLMPVLRVLKTEEKDVKEVMPSMLALISIAVAVGILARSVKKLSTMDPTDLLLSFAIVSVLSLVVGAVARLVGKSELTAGAGAGLLMMSAGILVISKAIASIAKTAHTYKDSYENVLNTLIIVLGGFSLLAVATNKHAKSILALGPSLLLVSAGLGLIALAIRALAGLDFEKQIVPGLLSMCAVLLTIGGMVRLMGKGSEDMLKIGTGIFEISAGMLVLAAAIAVIGKMDIHVLGQGLIVLAGALVVFGLAAAALTYLGIAEAFEGIGKTMLKFGVGVLALAAAFAILSPLAIAIPGIFIAMAIGIVGAVGIILASIVALSGLIGAALLALVKVICKVIVSASGDIGEAIEALVLVVLKAIRAGGFLLAQLLVEILIVIMYTLEANMDQLCERLVRLIIRLIWELCETLKRNSKALMYTLANLVYTIGSYLLNCIKQAVLMAVPWPKKVRSVIEKGFGEANKDLKSALKVEEGKKYMEEWGSKVTKAGGDSIKNNTPYAKQQAENLGNVMRDGVGGPTNDMLGTVLGNFTQMNTGMNRLFHPFKSTTSKYKTEIFDSLVFSGGDISGTSLEEYVSEFDAYLPKVNESSGFLGKTVANNLDVSEEAGTSAKKSGNSYDKTLRSMYPNVKAGAGGFRKVVKDELDKSPADANRSATKASNNYTSKLRQGTPNNRIAAASMREAVIGELEKGKQGASRAGSATSAGHSFELRKGSQRSASAAKATTNAVIREYNKAKEPVKGVARYTVRGYNQTIQQSSTSTSKAVRNVVMGALAAAKKALGIASPSKEFGKLGMFSMAGYIQAITKNKKKVSHASASVATTALQSFGNTMDARSRDLMLRDRAVQNTTKAVSEQIKNGINSKPKITPVLDAKTFDKDLKKTGKKVKDASGSVTFSIHDTDDSKKKKNNSLKSLQNKSTSKTTKNASTYTSSSTKSSYSSSSSNFSSNSSNSSSSASSTSSITQDHLNALKSFAAANKYTQNNILDQVRKVRQDINQLTSTMAAMKIQLDTGALVGNLVVPLDKALGKQANLNGRR